MARIAELESTYELIGRFVDVAFRTQDSLFTPGTPIWSPDVCNDLYARFVEHPDESSRSFLDKLKGQLEGADRNTVQLAAELLFVQTIPAYGIGRGKKIELIEHVLGWSEPPVPFPDDWKSAFDRGLANDMSFMQHRPFHIAFLLEVLRKWHTIDNAEQERMLSDPWLFKEFLQDVPAKAGQPMREMLCHLVFPDSFEPISSRKHKKLIHEAFQSKLTSSTGDVDQDLLAIREFLTSEHGAPISFYSPAIASEWQPGVQAPDESSRRCFLAWLQKCAASDSFYDNEVGYKIEIAERTGTARSALLSNDPNWLGLLKQAFGPPNNLTNWRTDAPFLQLAVAEPERVAASLRHLWSDSGDLGAAQMANLCRHLVMN